MELIYGVDRYDLCAVQIQLDIFRGNFLTFFEAPFYQINWSIKGLRG